MMTEQVRAAAGQLLDALAAGVPIAPLSEADERLTVEDAYRVQEQVIGKLVDDGDTIIGYKVGLTSAVMQRQLGVFQPDFGHLLASKVTASGQPIDVEQYISPRIEPEIAFVLGEPLSGPGVTVADAVRATSHVLASFEVIDSRIADWRITISDTIADNASSGGVVLGTRPRLLHELDLNHTGVIVKKNGEIVATGAGGAVLGSPINALVWLANTLGSLGVTIPAGSVILPGALTKAVPINQGDVISAEFGGLGSVSTHIQPKGA